MRAAILTVDTVHPVRYIYLTVAMIMASMSIGKRLFIIRGQAQQSLPLAPGQMVVKLLVVTLQLPRKKIRYIPAYPYY